LAGSCVCESDGRKEMESCDVGFVAMYGLLLICRVCQVLVDRPSEDGLGGLKVVQ
jgi:hypothetical protein